MSPLNLSLLLALTLWTAPSSCYTPTNVNSCPDVFQYDTTQTEEPGRWNGKLTVKSEFHLSGIWVRVIFDKPVQLVGSTFSPVETDNDLSFLFVNPSYILTPSDTLEIPFLVEYSDLDPPPLINTIRVNGRTICPQNTNVKVSPCPNVVQYGRQDLDVWFAKLNLRSDVELTGIWLSMGLDYKAELVGSKFGTVETTDNQNILIKNPDYTLKPGDMLEISIFVKYSILSFITAIKSVLLNGRTVCGPLPVNNSQTTQSTPENELEPNRKSLIDQTNIPLTDTATALQPPPSTTKFILPPFRCGVRETTERILSGLYTTVFDFPWHGVIFHKSHYVCGMSLISPYHAVTAAHCFFNSFTQEFNISLVDVYFGLSNLDSLQMGDVQAVKIAQLFKHPSYRYHTPMNDIAVIKFDRKVSFNERVQPICLWDQDTDLRLIVNQTGIVVGFGLKETMMISKQLLWTNLTVVDRETCIEKDRHFYGVNLSRYSFCAGSKKSSVCRGDSGGGMFFKKPGTEIWQLRGIISTSNGNDEGCKRNTYVIFTDVATYQDWIPEQMTK